MTNEQIVARIQAGEDVSANLWRLYDQNMGLIRKCALPLSGGAELEDLLQESFFTVESAARNYKPDSDVPFANYFATALKRNLQRYCNSVQMVREPEYRKSINAKCRKLSDAIEQRTGTIAADAVIMALGDVDADAVEGFRRSEVLSRCASLSAPIAEDVELADVVPDNDSDFTDGVIEDADRAELYAEVRRQLNDLPEKERQVVEETLIKGHADSTASVNLHSTVPAVRKRREAAVRRLTGCLKLRQLADSYDYTSGAAYHGGFESFRTSGDSSVERSAMKHLEQVEAAEKAERLYAEIVALARPE